jgi:hypothetical protein
VSSSHRPAFKEMVAAGKEKRDEFFTDVTKSVPVACLNVFLLSSVNYFLFKLLSYSSNAVIMLEYRQGKFNVTEDTYMKCCLLLLSYLCTVILDYATLHSA